MNTNDLKDILAIATEERSMASVRCMELVGALRADIASKLNEARLYGGDYYTGYRDGLVIALNAIDSAKESAPTSKDH